MTVVVNNIEPIESIRNAECDLSSNWEIFRSLAFEKLTKIGFPSRKSEAWQYIKQNEIYQLDATKGKEAKISNKLFDPSSSEEMDDKISGSALACERYFENQEIPSVLLGKLKTLIEDEKDFYSLVGASIVSQVISVSINEDLAHEKILRLAGLMKKVNSSIIFITIKQGVTATLGLLLTALQQNTVHGLICIELEDSAVLNLDIVNAGCEQSVLLQKIRFKLQANTRLNLVGLYGGSKISRNELLLDLLGKNINVDIKCLSAPNGKKEQHHSLEMNHHSPECCSAQLFRNILLDKSTVTVDGTVNVKNYAIDTKSDQLINTLFLSDDATIKVKPNLHIINDDVKCSHGNTIGALDENSLFYLKSRGLDDESARDLLTKSFANEILDAFKYDLLKQFYESKMSD